LKWSSFDDGPIIEDKPPCVVKKLMYVGCIFNLDALVLYVYRREAFRVAYHHRLKLDYHSDAIGQVPD